MPLPRKANATASQCHCVTACVYYRIFILVRKCESAILNIIYISMVQKRLEMKYGEACMVSLFLASLHC